MQLQQQLISGMGEMRDEKLAQLQRQMEDNAAAQQAVFDQKVVLVSVVFCSYWQVFVFH